MLPGFCKSGKNWTIRSCITAAPLDQLEQSAAHRFQRRRLAGKFFGMLKGNRLDLAAGSFAVVPQTEKRAYLFD